MWFRNFAWISLFVSVPFVLILTSADVTAQSTVEVAGAAPAVAVEINKDLVQNWKVLVKGSPIHGANGLAFDSHDRLHIASVIGREIVVMDPRTGKILNRLGPAVGVETPDDLTFGPLGSVYQDDVFWTAIFTGEVGRLSPDGDKITAGLVFPGVNPITFSDDNRLFVAHDFWPFAGLYEIDPDGTLPPDELDPDFYNLNAFDFGPDGLLYGPIFQERILRIDVDSGPPPLDAEDVLRGPGLRPHRDPDSNPGFTELGQTLELLPGNLGDRGRGGEKRLQISRPTATGGHRSESVTVRIPPGVADGGQIRLRGKGGEGLGGGPAGDLIARIRVRSHPLFRRDNRDISLEVPLTIAEATLGTQVEVPTLDGRVTVTIPPGTDSGSKLRLRGKGVPDPSGGAAGDFYVTVKISVPKKLDDAAAQQLRELANDDPTNLRAELDERD